MLASDDPGRRKTSDSPGSRRASSSSFVPWKPAAKIASSSQRNAGNAPIPSRAPAGDASYRSAPDTSFLWPEICTGQPIRGQCHQQAAWTPQPGSRRHNGAEVNDWISLRERALRTSPGVELARLARSSRLRHSPEACVQCFSFFLSIPRSPLPPSLCSRMALSQSHCCGYRH